MEGAVLIILACSHLLTALHWRPPTDPRSHWQGLGQEGGRKGWGRLRSSIGAPGQALEPHCCLAYYARMRQGGETCEDPHRDRGLGLQDAQSKGLYKGLTEAGTQGGNSRRTSDDNAIAVSLAGHVCVPVGEGQCIWSCGCGCGAIMWLGGGGGGGGIWW